MKTPTCPKTFDPPSVPPRLAIELCKWVGLAAAALGLLAACGEPRSGPAAIRLVDLFGETQVEGTPPVPSEPTSRTEWRFDDTTEGWQPGPGVADLGVRDGRLRGRSTTDLPIVHVERTTGLEDPDPLHAVEIRLRVDQGANLCLAFMGEETIDFDLILAYARQHCPIGTPIVPAGEPRSYTLTPSYAVRSSDIRHVLLQPTDAAGAEFEIDSVRLIFRREHLAGMASGVSWQGLRGIFRETLVTRSPETVRFGLRLPARPWLDLALGTVEEKPVTFRLGVAAADGGPESVVLERTLTTSDRWETVPVDLAAFAGQAVSVSLSLAADEDGTLGLWGAPAVRSRLPAGSGPETPQGVILIVADTLRADHLQPYGYQRPTAPVLSRLAAEGVVFGDCIAQASWTKVSMASILSSLYPTTHGVALPEDRLPAAAVTLSEVYREAGYATLSLSSIFFSGRSTNLHQGFEELHEADSLTSRQPNKTAREYVDRLLPWLAAHRDVPFFALLHVFDPHDPFRPYSPYDTLWTEAEAIDDYRQQRGKAVRMAGDRMHNLGRPLRDELEAAEVDLDGYLRTEKALYDGSIRAMDVEIGRLIERLGELGLADRTLVAFLSDHGEEFLEHGRHFHGQSVYGELIQVPLILWWPGGLPAGEEIDETVETLDLMPTLLALSGLSLPEDLQGRSLMPLIGSGDEGRRGWRPRPAIAEKARTQTTTFPGYAPPPRETESVAIIAGGWKLIHHRQRPEGRPEYELFDHRNDPLDRTDLAADNPEVVADLVRQLEAWRESVSARRLEPDAEMAESLSGEELERLRSLGYVQ